MGGFELLLSQGSVPESKRDALRAVGDTMFMGQVWFKDYGLEPKPEDLLRFAEIVLRYELDRERLDLGMSS